MNLPLFTHALEKVSHYFVRLDEKPEEEGRRRKEGYHPLSPNANKNMKGSNGSNSNRSFQATTLMVPLSPQKD